MIYYAVIVTMICLGLFILYFRQQQGLKKLVKDIQVKKETETNIILTTKTYSQSLENIIQEFNILFTELQTIKITSQQEKSTLDLAIHNITHDIRTPLTIANGYLYQLKDLDLSVKDKEAIKKIEINLKTVANRLEVLMEYQNLMENNIKPNFTALNFSQYFKEQLLTYYDALTKLNFTVEPKITDDLWIENDQDLLDRITQNIFSNILKHGENKLTIDLQQHEKFVQLKVKNQAKQPIKNLSKLTTRFYSENLAEIEDSSGLGLFIVQELATLSHGYLELDASGKDFELTLLWPIVPSKN